MRSFRLRPPFTCRHGSRGQNARAETNALASASLNRAPEAAARRPSPCRTRRAAASGGNRAVTQAIDGNTDRLRLGWSSRSRRADRSGISLLEVLISMFVLVFGLLGVAAMFPVGQHYVLQAVQYDRGAALGQSALNEVKARGHLRFDRVDYCLTANGHPFPGSEFPPGTGMIPILASATGLRGVPFAIDPLGCAVNSAAGASIEYFPSLPPAGSRPPGAPEIRRATLARLPGPPPLPIDESLAEELFRSRDDLAVDLPADPDQPSIQRRNMSNTKRQFRGDYSWLFTAVPAFDAGASGLYTISVVVFYKRPLLLDPNDSTPGGVRDSPPERMVDVDGDEDGVADGLAIGGYGGVDVNLHVDAKKNGITGGYLERIKPGEWVMLSGVNGGRYQFRWYRIIAVEDEIRDRGNDVFTRWLSLSGPNWDTNTRTYVSLFEGAIAVHERTMRIE